MTAARKIVTHNSFPPIPVRQFDWCAFYDGEEEAGSYGYGATEAEAVADFIENCAEDHDERLGDPAREDITGREREAIMHPSAQMSAYSDHAAIVRRFEARQEPAGKPVTSARHAMAVVIASAAGAI